MKKNLLVAFGILYLCSQVAAQTKLIEKVTKTGDELVIPYEKYMLSNGLTVIVHEDHSDPVIHVDVTYHVGSAREEIGKSGFAHFFEHMMFQGSDDVADDQHFKIVTEAGGTLNGSTNRDRTNYYETVPNNQLEKMLWLEADRMGFLLDAVTQKKFENQRETVKNERGQNYDNRPYGLSSEVLSKNLYPYGHPYSWMTIGYVEDLNRVNVNDLKNFFLRWYSPNNAALNIGGDVKTADVIRLAEKYFGVIPRGPEVQKVVVPKLALDKDRYVSYTDNYARLPMLTITYPGVPFMDKDMAALDCLASILGQGNNSVLYQKMVKPQLALQASAFSSQNELAGEISFRISPLPGKSLGDMEKLVRASLDSFEARGVTDEDILRFKGSNESRFIYGLQSVQGKVNQLASYQFLTGNPKLMMEEFRMLDAVTKDDVMRVYNQYIKNSHAVILSVLTRGQGDMIAKADDYKIDSSKYKAPEYGYASLKYTKPKDNFDRKKMPGNGPNPVVKVPVFWKVNTKNGLKIIGAENNEIPVINLSISIPGGHLLQASDTSKIGLARLFASMMNEDTKHHSAEQMALELQKLGSTINITSGMDDIRFNIQCLKKNLDKTLDLLQERMLQPMFTEKTFNRRQKQTLEALKQEKSRPAAVADDIMAKLNYGPDNILGKNLNGTESTIKNITLADVENYYTNYISSQDTKVVIVGDVRESEIQPKLDFLNKLPNKKIALPPVDPRPLTTTKAKIYLVDVPKAAQTEFRVGYATGLKYDATGEYYRANLMNFSLGGGFNSRLNMNLREDKGWTYGARSSFDGTAYTGDFEFSSGIKAGATDSALIELVKEIRNFSTNGITDSELAFMKNAIGQRDALQYETGQQKARFISRILEYQLPSNYVEQQNKILKDITKAEINNLAKKWIQPDKLNMLMVGDKAKILAGLQKMGYPIEELDSEGKSVEKRAF